MVYIPGHLEEMLEMVPEILTFENCLIYGVISYIIAYPFFLASHWEWTNSSLIKRAII